MAAAFTFEDLTPAVNGHIMLECISTAVPDHDCTVVIGSSGAGKSTLLRMCNRLDVPTDGSLTATVVAARRIVADGPVYARRTVADRLSAVCA